jgi:hypothetical protein
MKPFDLEQALAGAPVCTREGKPVTQLTKFDLPEKGVVRLVGVTSGRHIERWYPNGSYEFHDHSQNDLLMTPVKKVGWIARFGYPHCSKSYVVGQVHESEEDAKAYQPDAAGYHEISWEE